MLNQKRGGGLNKGGRVGAGEESTARTELKGLTGYGMRVMWTEWVKPRCPTFVTSASGGWWNHALNRKREEPQWGAVRADDEIIGSEPDRL